MNRIVNLKKQPEPVRQREVSQPSPSPAPTPVVFPIQPQPSVSSTPLALKPQPVIQVVPERQPVAQRIEWQFSSSTQLRQIWIMAAVMVAMGLLVAWFGLVLLGAILVLAASVLALQNTRAAPHRFMVLENAVVLDDRIHRFKDIRSFWIRYVPGGVQELSIHLRGWYLPYLRIPLYGQDPLVIRKILLKFVPEKEHQPSLIDALFFYLGM